MILSLQVQGTDGYFSIGYGPYNRSLAGAGVSMYNVSLIGGNPAGNVFLDNGYMLSVSFFSPVRSFEVSGAPSMAPTRAEASTVSGSDTGLREILGHDLLHLTV